MPIPNYSVMSDAQLVTLTQEGNTEAFGELYERYVNRIYHYVFRRTSSREDAEDVTAQVFFKALKSIQTYKPKENIPFRAWLFRIAHNETANHLRSLSRHPIGQLLEKIHKSGGNSPVHQAEDSELTDALISAIQQLKPSQQQVVILKLQGLSNLEIATILNKSESAVKSLFHRALTQLRKELSGYM